MKKRFSLLSLVTRHSSLSIGLLGGSFNPAHAGHLHISREALKRLQLDAVWWLVSPKNPLKDASSLATYEKRLEGARRIAKAERRITASDFEAKAKTAYTVDTVSALQAAYPDVQFVWLMGADNLGQFHRWRHWQELFAHIPIAVFDRAPFLHHALRSKAALHYKAARVPMKEAALLATQSLPAWCYLPIRRHPASATEIRQSTGKQ